MYNHNQHVHFVGIGGVGMAGIAEVLLNLGYSVSGSDIKDSSLIEHLRKLGAAINLGHNSSNLSPDTSVVVYSSAVHADNPELIFAREKHIPIIPRAEMLGELMRVKYGIAVAGSHGKTTTTTMIAKILGDVGFDPTVIVGGRVMTGMSGARLGTGDYLVAEADESDGSFQHLRPAIAVVTNIDREHLSYYGSFGKLEEGFRSFLANLPFYGLVVACFDDPVVEKICGTISRRICSYGLMEKSDVSARDITISEGHSKYTLVLKGEEKVKVDLPLPGVHLVKNSLAAIAVAIEVGVYAEEAAESLRCFPGVARRSEIIGRNDDVILIDDYGHHPTEIAATLLGLRRAWIAEYGISEFGKGSVGVSGSGVTGAKGGYRRLKVLFQPHRYSRTQEVFADFLDCFSVADEVIVTDIYAAGESPIPGISAEKLASSMQHPHVRFIPSLQEAKEDLLKNWVPGDIILSIGAGNVWQVTHQIASELNIGATRQ